MVTIDSRIIWEIINFLVLLWLLKKFLYRPITEILDKRSQKIKEDLESAKRSKEEAAQLKKEYEKELKQAREKAQQIIEEAEKRAREKADGIINEAKREAEGVKERNLQEIAQAKADARDELRKEVLSLSLMVASKFMREKLDQSSHEDLINQYINNLDSEKLGEMT